MHRWKRQLRANSSALYQDVGRPRKEEPEGASIEELSAQIGRLQRELEWLKKRGLNGVSRAWMARGYDAW